MEWWKNVNGVTEKSQDEIACIEIYVYMINPCDYWMEGSFQEPIFSSIAFKSPITIFAVFSLSFIWSSLYL